MRLLCLLLLVPAAAAAQIADPSSSGRDLPEGHTPRGALRRALVAPGWGQIYNRQYIKLPLVYGGLGGFIGGALYHHREKVLYSRAYGFRFCEQQPNSADCLADPRTEFEGDYEKVLRRVFGENAANADLQASQIKAQRDILRRNRDLLLIGSGVFYALTVLDAYVSAHLMHFDVGEDLTVRAAPAGTSGLTATLALRF